MLVKRLIIWLFKTLFVLNNLYNVECITIAKDEWEWIREDVVLFIVKAAYILPEVTNVT